MQNELKPELRFPEFEEDYKLVKIEDITTWSSGGTPSKDVDEYWNGEIPWISASSMRGIEYTDSNLRITEAGLKSGSRQAKKNSLLILVRGSMLFKTIPIGIATRDVAFNQDVKSIKVSPKSTPKFILQWFLSKENKLLSMVTGTGIGAGKLDLADLKLLQLPLPSLPEQNKIANFLSALDEKIQALTKKKTLLEQYKKGVMQRLFSQEIRFKDEQGQDFPDWEEKRLGDIASFLKGKGISKADIIDNGKLECIRYGELYTHYQETIRNVISRTDAEPSNLVFSKYNDVIIPASGETQLEIAKASCVLKDGVALGGDLNILRTKTNGVFLSYYLNFGKKQEIAALAQGISVVHLYSSQLAALTLQMPKLEEQQKIADFLTAIDGRINDSTQQIEAAQSYKKGLLQKMFV